MNDHSHYEESAALAAGGHLGGEDLSDLQQHVEICPQCKITVAEFREPILAKPITHNPLSRLFFAG
jgi:hypothetical protein